MLSHLWNEQTSSNIGFNFERNILIMFMEMRTVQNICLDVWRIGLTIAAKLTITIVIDSQKYYHDRLSIVDFTIAILSR